MESLSMLTYYSLWRPDSLPTDKSKIITSKLRSIGDFGDVTRKIMSISQMKYMLPRPKNGGRLPIMRLVWDNGPGVILQYRTEQFKDDSSGDVLTISIISGVDRGVFGHLYAQLYEHLGVILLDEETHRFMTPKEYKNII
jgi:hypothetical protein